MPERAIKYKQTIIDKRAKGVITLNITSEPTLISKLKSESEPQVDEIP